MACVRTRGLGGRRLAGAALLLALAAACGWARPAAADDSAGEDALARARFLDQQGVRAYAEGRYLDAATLFREAYRSGGPPSELWNIAKCHLKMDDGRGAEANLREYLAQDGLSAGDRAEGERMLAEVESRPSTFVVASDPDGATVYVDGTPVGTTPLTTTIASGDHDVRVARADAPPHDDHVRARDGAPVVLSVPLRGGGPDRGEPRRGPRRFSVQLGLGPNIGVHGADGPHLFVVGSLAVGYSFWVSRSALLGVALRAALTGDQWTTTPGVPNTTAGCTPPADFAGAEVELTPVLYGAVRVGRVSVGAKLGVGASLYSTGTPIGGDLFYPACDASPGPVVDVYGGLEISLPVTPAFRVVVAPLEVDGHAAFDGARTTPLDVTGPWLRFASTIGAAVDF